MDPGHRFKIFLLAFLRSEPIEADGRAPPALLRLGRRSAGADANFAEDMLLLHILALRVFFISVHVSSHFCYLPWIPQ